MHVLLAFIQGITFGIYAVFHLLLLNIWPVPTGWRSYRWRTLPFTTLQNQ